MQILRAGTETQKEKGEKMTNEEIENYEKELCRILKLDFEEQPSELQKLGKMIGINLPHSPENTRQKQTIHMTQAAHSFFQTKMILNACVSAEESSKLAKWCCIWAAVAAIAACITVILTLCLG